MTDGVPVGEGEFVAWFDGVEDRVMVFFGLCVELFDGEGDVFPLADDVFNIVVCGFSGHGHFLLY